MRKTPTETAVPGQVYSYGYDQQRQGDVQELALYSHLFRVGVAKDFVKNGRPKVFSVGGSPIPIRSQMAGGLEFFIIGSDEKYVYMPLRTSQLHGLGPQEVVASAQNV
ncbi:hypothetical protein HYV84_00600 [Candidatus Woesearchaeota archaeon]|nr:hypothetical protein [Candidatus Woesearchaeota archaeon]